VLNWRARPSAVLVCFSASGSGLQASPASHESTVRSCRDGRLIDFVYRSTLGLRVMKKKKKDAVDSGDSGWRECAFFVNSSDFLFAEFSPVKHTADYKGISCITQEWMIPQPQWQQWIGEHDCITPFKVYNKEDINDDDADPSGADAVDRGDSGWRGCAGEGR